MGIEYPPIWRHTGGDRAKGESDSYAISFRGEPHSNKSQLITAANVKGKQQILMQTTQINMPGRLTEELARSLARFPPPIINHGASSSDHVSPPRTQAKRLPLAEAGLPKGVYRVPVNVSTHLSPVRSVNMTGECDP